MSNVQAPQLQEVPAQAATAEEVASQIDLTKMSLSAPVYKYRRFYQVQGGASFSPTGSNYLSQFVIPGSSVWNFARSYITFDVLHSLLRANDANARLSTAFTDTFPIDSIQLQTDNGTVLANIQNAQAYLKICQALVTDEKTLCSKSPVQADASMPPAAFPRNVCNGLNPFKSNDEIARASQQLIASVASGAYFTNTVPSIEPCDETSGTDRIGLPGVQRLVSGLSIAAGAAATFASCNVRYRLDLAAIVGTILAVDKDMHFGTNLQLQIYFKPRANWGFFSTVDTTTIVPTESTAVAVSNYYLYMAEDINDEITLPMINQVRTNGASVYVPYTVSSQFSTDGTAGYASSNIPLVPGEGLRLKRILTNAILSSNTLSSTANTFNVNGAKVTALQSYLDSKPLQDQELKLLDSDIYNYLSDKCKDSCALLSERTFEENFFWCDDFSDCESSLKYRENDCKLSGLSVDMQKNYALRVNKAALGLILCHWKTYVRMLTIKPSGISWGQ